MDAKTFLDNFEAVAEAPGGVQRLRDLVLELAVNGRLVEQDPADEPAMVALSGVALRRDAAMQEMSLRLRRPRSAVEPTVPDRTPRGWAEVLLGDAFLIVMGNSPPGDTYNESGDGVPLLNGPVEFSPPPLGRTILRQYTTAPTRLCEEGDLLVCVRGATTGRTNIAGFNACIGRGVALVRGWSYQPFVNLLMWNLGSRLLAAGKGTTFPSISQDDLANLQVAIPPLAEQDRIVAKVDELMRLCDELAARQKRRHHATTRFRGSALHDLIEAETPDDLLRAWQRVSANWPAITIHKDDIAALQATLLQLAIKGRLAGRIDGEGTALDVLDQIHRQRSALAADGLIAKPKARTAIDPGDVPFPLPDHWLWVHVEDVVTHVVDCLHRTPTYVERGFAAIRTCDVEPGRVLLDQALLVDGETFREQVRRLVPQAGDVFYSREGGRFGIAAVVPPGVQLCLSQRMMQFRCADGIVPEYFSWFLNSPLGFGQASQDVGGSASPHVNIKSIRRFLLPLPPSGEQSRIVAGLERMLSQIDQLRDVTDRTSRIGELMAGSIAAAGVHSP